MKILNKTISLIIIIAILLNITACSKLTDIFDSSKASASNATTDSVINDANNNAKEIDKIESANVSIEFSFTPTSNNTIKGKCQFDAFITDMKAHLSTIFTKNDSSSEKNVYLDQTNLLFSFDGTSYYKFDLSSITSFAPKLNTILNFVKNINSTDSKSDVQSNSPNQQESTDSSFFSGTNFQNLLQTTLSISNSLTLDGTKTIDGHEMHVLKVSITNENINSLLDTSSYSSNIPGDILRKLTSVDGIDVELYVSASGENIIGFCVNLSNIVSTFCDIKSADNNYIQLLFGLNTSKEFQSPNAKELEFMDIISNIPNIVNPLEEYFDSPSELFKSLDIKEVIFTIIKDYVYGESESLEEPTYKVGNL